MILLDLSLATPEEDLALEEALLRDSDATGREFLRLWESSRPFVVLGVSGRLRADVRVEACRRDAVPILRRLSGGGTVLQGPGCLNYSLVLSLSARPELRDLRRSYVEILGRVARALALDGMESRGISDLAILGHKVSGNAQKRTASTLLHHGTILHGLDPALVARWLEEPAKQPEYREGRLHGEFLENVPLETSEIRRRLAAEWGAEPAPWSPPPLDDLIAERYGNPAWTERF